MQRQKKKTKLYKLSRILNKVFYLLFIKLVKVSHFRNIVIAKIFLTAIKLKFFEIFENSMEDFEKVPSMVTRSSK